MRSQIRHWIQQHQQFAFFQLLGMGIINMVLTSIIINLYDKPPTFQISSTETLEIKFAWIYLLVSGFLFGMAFVYYALEKQIRVPLNRWMVKIHLMSTFAFLLFLYFLPIFYRIIRQGDLLPNTLTWYYLIMAMISVAFIVGQLLFIINLFRSIFKTFQGKR